MLKFNETWLNHWLEQMMNDIEEVYAIDTEGSEIKGELVKTLQDQVCSLVGTWHSGDTPKDTGLKTISFTSKALNAPACTDTKDEPVFFVREEGLYSRARFSLREGDENGDL